MKNPNGQAEDQPEVRVTYTVRPETVEGCDCEDCKAGRHIYSLYRWRDGSWRWAATSLQSYPSPEDCKARHSWGIDFGPNAVWEDGTPVVEPVDTSETLRDDGCEPKMVPIDTRALLKSFESIMRHWE